MYNQSSALEPPAVLSLAVSARQRQQLCYAELTNNGQKSNILYLYLASIYNIALGFFTRDGWQCLAVSLAVSARQRHGGACPTTGRALEVCPALLVKCPASLDCICINGYTDTSIFHSILPLEFFHKPLLPGRSVKGKGRSKGTAPRSFRCVSLERSVSALAVAPRLRRRPSDRVPGRRKLCRHLQRRSGGDPHAGRSPEHQLQRHLGAPREPPGCRWLALGLSREGVWTGSGSAVRVCLKRCPLLYPLTTFALPDSIP
jgi:hypothetical protein